MLSVGLSVGGVLSVGLVALASVGLGSCGAVCLSGWLIYGRLYWLLSALYEQITRGIYRRLI